MARTPPTGTQRTTQQRRTQRPPTQPRPTPPDARNPREGWRRRSRGGWKERFLRFLKRPRDGRRALERHAGGAGDDARVAPVVVDCVDVATFDPELCDGLLRWPEKLLPVFDEALADALEELLRSPAAARRPEWRARRAKVRLRNVPPLPEHAKPNVSALRCADVGPLVQVCGTVVRTGGVKVLEASRTYRCCAGTCGTTFTVYPDPEQGNLLERPQACPGPDGLGGCAGRRFVEVASENADYQEARLQEHIEQLSIGAIPRSLTLVLEHDLADSLNAGDAVTVVGWLERRWQPVHRDVRVDVDLVLRVNAVHVGAASAPGASRVTDEDRAFFAAHWRRAARARRPLAARDAAVDSVCPQIFGRRTIKLAVLLTAIGGCGSDEPGGEEEAAEERPAIKTRGTPHLLLVGDPGTGKSQFLRFMARLAQRSILTTGCGTTSAGLTCSAVKDDGEWMLEAGALVLADRGVCCIDEFGAIKPGDRAAIHEAMEQQTLSVAKAGLVCKLAARCAVMACANPRGGKYDARADLSVNTSLPPPLLSRFDVVLVVVDEPDEAWDRAVSAQILNDALAAGAGALDPFEAEGDEPAAKRPRPAPRPRPWALDRLRKYVAHVRGAYRPTLGDDASRLISAYYARQRQATGAAGGRATIRMLESLVRITQAHARLCCRHAATAQDAVVACLLVDKSMMGTAVFAATTDPIPELTVSDDSDAYYLYQGTQVFEALGLGGDGAEGVEG